jgi:hypothetical protein
MVCACPDGNGEKLAGADSGFKLSPRQTGLKSTPAPDEDDLYVSVPTQPGTHRLTIVAGVNRVCRIGWCKQDALQ